MFYMSGRYSGYQAEAEGFYEKNLYIKAGKIEGENEGENPLQ